MKASYRLLDYSLRPAKFAERKMLCEMFSRLRPFSPLQDYQYVGFGSIWFADHLLFHKSLGIQEMISIERVGAHKSRFEFNRPFANVDIRIGAAKQHLPSLDWDKRLILWLDYDDALWRGILDDVHTVAMRAKSGLALAVSVQAEEMCCRSDADDEGITPIVSAREFRKEFGDKRTPQDLDPRKLKGWGIAKTTRELLREELKEAVLARNLALPEEHQLKFRQIGAFEYADGARMTTVVGVFVNPTEDVKFQACGFDELHYFKDGIGAVRIKVPKLTPKEMRHLDTFLPGLLAANQLGPIPPADASHYARFYRYLPNYASFEP